MVIPDGAIPPYVRHDLAHGDPKDRPSNEAYDRFVFLAARYRDSGYDDRAYPESMPFAVAGPLFNAIFLWSEHALEEIARIVGADPARIGTPPNESIRHRAPSLGPGDERFCALDVVRGERSAEATIVSFMPLLDPALPKDQLEAIVADLHSASFHPDRTISYVVPSFDSSRRASTPGSTGAAPSGSTPTGCCTPGFASTATTRLPTRSS